MHGYIKPVRVSRNVGVLRTLLDETVVLSVINHMATCNKVEFFIRTP